MEINKEALKTNNDKLKALGDGIATCDVYQLGVSDGHKFDLTRATVTKKKLKVAADHARALSEQYLTSGRVYVINEDAMKEEKELASQKAEKLKSDKAEMLTGKKRQAELDSYASDLAIREEAVANKEKELAEVGKTYEQIHKAIEGREKAIEAKEAELKEKEETIDARIDAGVKKELAAIDEASKGDAK